MKECRLVCAAGKKFQLQVSTGGRTFMLGTLYDTVLKAPTSYTYLK